MAARATDVARRLPDASGLIGGDAAPGPRPPTRDPAQAWPGRVVRALLDLAPCTIPGCLRAELEPATSIGSGDEPGDRMRISLLSAPADEGGELLGVLVLYAEARFGPGAAEPAALLARAAVAAIAAEREAACRERQLRTAMESRDVIGQAKGVLMAQSGLDADSAFRVLVRASQRQNRKLRDVAADIAGRPRMDGGQ